MSIVAGMFGFLPIMFSLWPAIKWSMFEFNMLFYGGIFIIVLGICSSFIIFDNFRLRINNSSPSPSKT